MKTCCNCCVKTCKSGNICFSCQKRNYKNRYPEKYAYQVLKNNAKRRGKTFKLTFEQFLEFAIQTNYMDKKGRTFFGLHIDRIDEAVGYEISNIQVLTNTENIKKFHNSKKYD